MRGGIYIEIKNQLILERERLSRINQKVKQELENVPEGSLRLSQCGGVTQYYHCKNNTPHNGVYIPKKEMKLIRQLAQKKYDQKILRYTGKSLAAIERILRDYDDNKIDEIYLSEHLERQKLINPVEPTYHGLLENWKSKEYVRKGFKDELPIIVTNKGIRVRSKSEKIMADYFDSIGLEFKYECPLYLEPYGIIYPDFTFLSKRTRKEVYWEHEGMMDNPDYARTAVQKIELYEKNGIFPGDNLILTFETSSTTINTELLKKMTERFLL